MTHFSWRRYTFCLKLVRSRGGGLVVKAQVHTWETSFIVRIHESSFSGRFFLFIVSILVMRVWGFAEEKE
jgi:hypothetical protein